MKDIIISMGPLAGLGDWLLYSTLPERFAKLGHKVLIHECGDEECDFDPNYRTDEQYDLLLAQNPFITGTTDRAPNAGHTRQGRFYDVVNRLPEGCAIEAMEKTHGLPPDADTGRYSLNPRIYYKPQPYHQDLSKVVLYDPTALSSAIDGQGWSRFQQKMMDNFGGDSRIYLVTHDPSVASVPPFAEGTATIGVGSLKEYADMLAGCRAWIGSESGAQGLAAAVRGEFDMFQYDARPEIVCLMAPNTRNSGSYCFRGVRYRTSIFSAGGDYLEPTEVPNDRYKFDCRRNGRAKLTKWREAKSRMGR